MQWSTACPDWRERILSGASLIPFPPLFPEEAAAARAIFEDLRVVDVAGRPRMGSICRPWLLDFVSAIFGAYDAETGRRLINEFFLLISKKNSKSTGAAGIMVTALLRNWRESAEFLILAPTLEIAKNSAEPAMDMVDADPELKAILRPIRHLRTIEHRTTGATLRVVAADSETVGGVKATGVLIDELWLFGKKANAENMLREATGGLASRPEGFVIALSTQSDEPPAGVFRDWLIRFRKIRDGELVAPRSLGVLYEFPEEMIETGAYKRPENFYVTNPNLGASVDEQYLLDELAKAEEKGPQSLVGFYAKHLNVEIGLALRTDRWAGADHWEAHGDRTLTLQALLDRSEVITIGIDGGGLDDLLGLCVMGREKVTKAWLCWNHAWAHPIVLERRKEIAPKLRDLAKAGDLTIVERLGQDIEGVVDVVRTVDEAGLLASVGLDPVGIGAIVDALSEIGVTGDRVVGIPQGWKLAGAIKTVERKLADGTFTHAGQDLMAWCVGNARVEPKGNAIMITKQASGTAKIDPLSATFDAAALMATNPEPNPRPAYQMFALG